MGTRRRSILPGKHDPIMSNETVNKAGTVGVVLVNWNGGEYTIPCIESLLEGNIIPNRIVVVDNASRDGSADKIVKAFPGIELIRNSENLGFTGANNMGIARLTEVGCEYIWVLNNDTTIDKQCLSTLKKYLDEHPEAAACSGKILYQEPERLIWYAGSTYSRWTVRSRHRGYGEEDRGQYDSTGAVPFLSGCCMFVRRSALDRIGAFDDHFFAYGEDADWCLRAREAGLRLDYVPGAVVRHKVNASVNKVKDRKTRGSTSPFSVYITSRNSLYLIRKHAENVLQAGAACIAYGAWTCYYGTVLLLLGRFGKLKALLVSVYDGATGSLAASDITAVKPRYLG